MVSSGAEAAADVCVWLLGPCGDSNPSNDPVAEYLSAVAFLEGGRDHWARSLNTLGTWTHRVSLRIGFSFASPIASVAPKLQAQREATFNPSALLVYTTFLRLTHDVSGISIFIY